MSKRDLATYLARWIFELGNGHFSMPVERLQFMHGKYSKDERAGGGICEGALVDQLINALTTYRERLPCEWQFIETAKLEGSIIGWMPGWQCGGEVHWRDGWYLANNDPTDSWGPGPLPLTHWQPLPAPPELKP